MNKDFIISFNSDVIISAAIFGRIKPELGNVLHKHNAMCRGLLEKIYKLSENDISIGYIPGTAEKEALRRIDDAIRDVLRIWWNDKKVPQEEREKLADAVSVFRKDVLDKLDTYILTLNREHVPNSKLSRYKHILREKFDELDRRYTTLVKYNEGMLKGNKDFKYKDKDAYKLGIEDTDIEIMAVAALLGEKTNKDDAYLAAIDRHMTAKWASDMIGKQFNLKVRKPDALIHIVDKRYRHFTRN